MTPRDLSTILDRWSKRNELLSDEIYDFETEHSLFPDAPRHIPADIWEEIGCALSCLHDGMRHLTKAVVLARKRENNG